jgi:type I restriction enzyme S subunit
LSDPPIGPPLPGLPSAKGYVRTLAGVIPADWEAARLEALAQRGSGHTPERSRPEYWDGNIPWLSLHDAGKLDRLYVDTTAAKITAAGLANSSAKIHPAGTVVLSRDATVGRSAILGRDMAVSQHFIAWKCGPSLQNLFLYYWLQSARPEFERVAIGNTIKTIGMPYFRQLHLPLPPRVEQEMIAEALLDADGLIALSERVLATKRQIKLGALQELLVNGRWRLTGSDGRWRSQRLGSLGVLLKGCGVTREEAKGGSLACVRYGEIYTCHHDVARKFRSWISPAVAATARPLKPGDILFAASGETRQEIGKAVAFVSTEEAYAGSDILILRGHSQDPVFLGYSLNSEPVRIQKASRGQGDAVVHISSAALASIELSLPPLAEQQAIGGIFADLDAELTALEAKLAKTRQVRQGMLQELLGGRIRLRRPGRKSFPVQRLDTL